MNWDNIFKKGSNFKPLNELYLNTILDKIKKERKKKIKTVIDLGCGTGDSLSKFAQKGYTVSGIDISNVALKKAAELFKKQGLEKIDLQCMDLNKLDITNKADIIFSKLMIAFIKDKDAFLKNVKKMMNKDSFFVLITPVLYKDIKYSKNDKTKIAVDFNEINKLLKNNFKKVIVFHHDYFGDKGDAVTFITY